MMIQLGFEGKVLLALLANRKHPIAPSEHPVLITSGLYDITRGNQFDAVLTWNTLEFSETTRSKPQ